MEALKAALAALNDVHARFTELVDPETLLRQRNFELLAAVGDTIVQLGDKVTELELRVAAIEAAPLRTCPPLLSLDDGKITVVTAEGAQTFGNVHAEGAQSASEPVVDVVPAGGAAPSVGASSDSPGT